MWGFGVVVSVVCGCWFGVCVCGVFVVVVVVGVFGLGVGVCWFVCGGCLDRGFGWCGVLGGWCMFWFLVGCVMWVVWGVGGVGGLWLLLVWLLFCGVCCMV